MKKGKRNTKKEERLESISMMKMKQNGTSFEHEQLNKALHGVQDLMERMGGCPFYPLHEFARVIGESWRSSMGEKSSGFTGDAVRVGVKESEFTEARRSMLQTLSQHMGFEVEKTDKGLTLDSIEGVPVEITVIRNNYKFFENPNITFWGVTEFLMPNPLDNYLKAQWLVK